MKNALKDLIFIDEFGATSNMTRRYARSPVGQRVVGRAPHGHWKVLSTIAAMDRRGILTAGTFDTAVDEDILVGFVRQCLVPKLRPGQWVILDNLPAHKSPQVAALIAATGVHVMHLPPYSLDFNPVERAISKIKTLLRRRGARSITSLHFAIGEALHSITPCNAAAYIKKAGYAATIN
jgi:transposase